MSEYSGEQQTNSLMQGIDFTPPDDCPRPDAIPITELPYGQDIDRFVGSVMGVYEDGTAMHVKYILRGATGEYRLPWSRFQVFLDTVNVDPRIERVKGSLYAIGMSTEGIEAERERLRSKQETAQTRDKAIGELVIPRPDLDGMIKIWRVKSSAPREERKPYSTRRPSFRRPTQK